MTLLEAQHEVSDINSVLTSCIKLWSHQVSFKATFIVELLILMTSNKDFFRMIIDGIRAFKKLTGIIKCVLKQKYHQERVPVWHQNFNKYVCFVALCFPVIYSDGMTAIKFATCRCKTILAEVILPRLICFSSPGQVTLKLKAFLF